MTDRGHLVVQFATTTWGLIASIEGPMMSIEQSSIFAVYPFQNKSHRINWTIQKANGKAVPITDTILS